MSSGSFTQLTCSPADANDCSLIQIGSGARALALADAERKDYALVDRRVLELHPDCIGDRDRERILTVDGGEACKSFGALETILRDLTRRGAQRSDVLTVIGGGTVGDLGGLAAALFLRGIELRQMPTTLLSMVDSSVGGKTAINIPEGKNLVGAFWTASQVFIDPDFIATLSDDDFRSGLGEVLKIAIGLDAELFAYCEAQRDPLCAREPQALHTAIEHCIRAKIGVVEGDYREGSRRQLLNLGHTLAHGLEAADRPRWPHGIAVARGLHFALDFAQSQRAIADADAERARSLLDSFGFDPVPIPDRATLAGFITRDKKRSGDSIDYVVPIGIGRSEVQRRPLDEVLAALE